MVFFLYSPGVDHILYSFYSLLQKKGFREGIKPVSVTGGAVSLWRGGLFATNIPRGKQLFATEETFRESYTDIRREKLLSARDIRCEKWPLPKRYRNTSYGDGFYTLAKTFSHEFLSLSKTLFCSSVFY